MKDKIRKAVEAHYQMYYPKVTKARIDILVDAIMRELDDLPL